MKKSIVFICGFASGILATFLVGYFLVLANKPSDDGLIGLNIFPKKGECITTTSKNKNSEIEVFQVLEPNMALASVKYYSDKPLYDTETFRAYDSGNEVTVLLINYEGKTFYDNQKIEVSKNCLRQIGTYQYTTKNNFGKTIPAVTIE